MQRFAIREGWTTVVLAAALVYLAILSTQQADWADGLGVLTWVAALGLAAGFVASKWREIPAAALHLAGVVIGLIAVVFTITTYIDDEVGTNRDKLRWLWDRGEVWIRQIINGEPAEDLYLFVLFVSAMSFLLGYLTIWFVFRARWIWAALFFPGVVVLLNTGYSQKVSTGLVVLFLVFAILMLMRFHLLQREFNWRRVRIDYPRTLVWRAFWVATYLSIAVIFFGWALPVDARSRTVNSVWHEVDGPWRTVEAQFNEWFVGLRGPGGGEVGGFAAFEDSFELGGPLSLSEDPVVVVDGSERPTYLKAHTYDVYTGRGWQSSISAAEKTQDAEADEDEADQVELLPQYELQPGEAVPLDERFIDERDRETFQLELQRPRGSLLFVPGSFASANVGANLVVSWRDLDETVDVQRVEEHEVPPEIWPLVELLRDVDLTPDELLNQDEDDTEQVEEEKQERPLPDVSKIPAEVREYRDDLVERGIRTSYQMDGETYRISFLSYSGSFPQLNDIEAAHARDGLTEGDQYEVEVLVSQALAEELRRAGDGYPEIVEERYLSLPETVTERTKFLAREIAEGHNNPYDVAKALETYLRENIVYDERIDFPPPDVDVVDHVLFTSQRGYCEYYSSAFIVMARSLGLPARMAVGFFPTDDKQDEGYVYRERNAHAWPEVYFPGYGWIGFEPTAAREAIERTPSNFGEGPERGPAPILGGEGRIEPGFEDIDEQLLEENLNLPTGEGVVGQAGEPVSASDVAIRVVPLTILLAILVIAYLWIRGTRGLSPANQMYTKFSRGATWGGVTPESAMTPHEYADQVARNIPGSRQPVTYLTDLYVKETYSPRAATQAEVMRARQAWLRLRGVLLRHLVSRLMFWRKPVKEEEYEDEDW